MGRHQVPGNRQAQPRAAGLARARPVGPVETVEDVGQVFRFDATPRVAHRDRDHETAAGSRDRDAAAGGRVCDGVVQQIAQHLPDAFGIHIHEGQAGRQLAVQGHALRFGLRLEHGGRLRDDRRQRGGLAHEGQLPGFCLRQLLQIGD